MKQINTGLNSWQHHSNHNRLIELQRNATQLNPLLLIPVDDSQHVLSFESVNEIIRRLNPKLVVPHHYYIWDVIQRQSTLQPVQRWLETQGNEVIETAGPTCELQELLSASQPGQQRRVLYFGEHVAFDTTEWRTIKE